MCKTLALAALLALAPFALAGDEARDPKSIAQDYLFGGKADAAKAEKEVAAASPELLRKILEAAREVAREPVQYEEFTTPLGPRASPPRAPEFAPAPAPPPGRGTALSCGGPDLDGPVLRAPELPPAPPGAPSATGPVVSVDVRFLHVTEEAAARLGLLRDPHKSGPQELTAEQVASVLAAVEKSEDVTQITAPSIAVYDRQTANVTVLNQISYIQDYDVEISNGTRIADPIVGTVQEGLLVTLRPAAAADRKSILFDVSFTVAELVRPIPVWKTKLAGGEEVSIQLPEVRILKRTQRAVVAPGTAVVLDTWPQIVQVTKDGTTTDERHLGVALLKAELIDAKDLVPSNFVPPEPGPEDTLPPPR